MAYFKCKGGPKDDYIYNWDFKQSLTDKKQRKVAMLSGGAYFSAGIGITMSSIDSKVTLLDSFKNGMTVEIDIPIMVYEDSGTTNNLRLFGDGQNVYSGLTFRTYPKTWRIYKNGSNIKATSITSAIAFSNSTLKMEFIDTNTLKMYLKDIESDEYTLVYNDVNFFESDGTYELCIGAEANAYYSVTISGIRIYNNQYNN